MIEKILDEYKEYRTAAEIDRKKRISDIFKEYPEIEAVENEIFKAGSKNMTDILENPKNGDKINAAFKENLKKLRQKRAEILKKYGVPENYNRVKYRCEKCSDTGYTPDGKKCVCLKQRMINEAYSRSNMGEMLEKQNFSNFSFDYYSKDGGEASPYENIKKIYNRAVNYCKNFDNETKGLWFYGKTGLGKTFVSSCIAKEIIESGKTVVYSRASRLFGKYEDYKFGRNPDRSIIDEIFNCDLLIIDDLGTEPKNSINNSFLFEIINERMSENKKIIVNTNYDFNEVTSVYSSRFTSRIFEYFIAYKFIGEDIRLQKLKN